MDSCYVPFQSGNAGVARIGAALDRRKVPKAIQPLGSISPRGVFLRNERAI
jgi:hypothetical protein